MNSTQDHWMTSLLFEHACKEDFNGVIKNVLEDKDLAPKVIQSSARPESQSTNKPPVQPVFMLIYMLKKLHSLESFAEKLKKSPEINVLSVIIELLDSTYKQYNFISLKQYFTLTSELRLLDLLNIITDNAESTVVIQKLNQHFPRWTPDYKKDMENKFHIKNLKVLDKVEESHTQCRRLILKLAVDKAYKAKYMAEQYPNDVTRLVKESKGYIKEVFTALESYAGLSILEKMANSEESGIKVPNDLSVQLLLDYIQPEITDDALLKFLDDFDSTLNSQPTSCLISCLRPFDAMSEISDEENEKDSEESSSEYESTEDVEESVKSCVKGSPSATSNATDDAVMDLDIVE